MPRRLARAAVRQRLWQDENEATTAESPTVVEAEEEKAKGGLVTVEEAF